MTGTSLSFSSTYSMPQQVVVPLEQTLSQYGNGGELAVSSVSKWKATTMETSVACR